MRLCSLAFLAISLFGTGAPFGLAQGAKVDVALPEAPVATSPEGPVSQGNIFARVVKPPEAPAAATSGPVIKIDLAVPAADGQPAEAPQTPAWAIDSEGKTILKGCSLSFEISGGSSMQVDISATTCLDEIAVTMQHRPGTRLTLVGNHLASEQKGASLAAERATVSKTFLEEQRGIDASRIDVRTGSSTTRSVETYILMPGVMVDAPPTEQHSEAN